LWRVLLETSLDNIYFKDIHSRFIKCSKAQARFFGVESPDELVGRTDFDFCAEADARARFEDEQKIIRTGEPIIAKEEREERKAGQVVWMSSTKMPLRDAAGKIIGIMGVSRDITGRKLVEQQVKEALDFNRTIILDAAVGITAFKASGHCILANDTAAQILNGTVSRLLAQDFRKLDSWRASGMLQIAEEVLATKTSRQCDVNFVSSFGKEVWLVSHLSHFVQNGEPHLLHVFSDVTERKKLETQFLRAQRMESIGTLAGGIAHDLNNVLTPLLFSVQILKEKISDDEGQQILDSLEANVKRGASLVKQVLAFGRGVKGDRILLQVRNLAREIEGIVQETFPKSVRFQLDAATGLWTVSCDPTQIHQVLLNLCVNARDAMPGGGKLSLRLNNVTLDAAHAAAHLDARPGPYVVISVEDTGMGISRDNQERIFEPFFTTKELGKGTGLGLSTTLAIVKSHGGFITCNSEPGKGTIFKVYLPASAEAATEAGVPEEQSQLPRGNDELVLVVDDEAPIREMAQHILERYGYRVVLAVNGFDAVQLYTTRQDEIATVLTDMAMPVMDGPATIAALQAVNPKVKIVGFSGLEMKGAEAEAFRLGCGRFVSKPFTAETLLQVLRAILHEPAGERSTDNKPKTKKKRG
jgi:PAS domain S-box-containing protein